MHRRRASAVRGDRRTGLVADGGRAPVARVFSNLIGNAVEALCRSRREHPRPRRGAGGGRIGVIVEDDGPGVAPEILPRLFDPYFSATQRRHGAWPRDRQEDRRGARRADFGGESARKGASRHVRSAVRRRSAGRPPEEARAARLAAAVLPRGGALRVCRRCVPPRRRAAPAGRRASPSPAKGDAVWLRIRPRRARPGSTRDSTASARRRAVSSGGLPRARERSMDFAAAPPPSRGAASDAGHPRRSRADGGGAGVSARVARAGRGRDGDRRRPDAALALRRPWGRVPGVHLDFPFSSGRGEERRRARVRAPARASRRSS